MRGVSLLSPSGTNRSVEQEASVLQWRLPARADSIPRLRHAAVEFFRTHCAEDDHVEHGIALAVNEACANAVRHAYPDAPGEINVEAHLPKDDVVLLVVEDRGVGIQAPSRDPGTGLGMQLMGAFSELRLRSDDRGTRVELRFHCRRSATGDRVAV
jgi:anti-sigma regulatory factor (Ser/Thr protein kinase)